MTTLTALKLSILIPTYNGLNLLRSCLAPFEEHCETIKLIVIDDGSSDGTFEWLRQHRPDVEIIRRETTGGFCRALLDGYTRVVTPYVAVLNNDVIVTSEWALAGISTLESHADVGAVACRVLQADRPDRIDSAGDTYFFFGANEKRGRNLHADSRLSWKLGSPAMAAAFYRVEALSDVGFVDAHFESHLEDIDLGLRLANGGWKCVYEPGAVCSHFGQSSYRPDDPRTVRRISRNAEGVYWSIMPGKVLLLGFPLHVMWLLLQAMRHLMRGKLIAFCVGKIAFISELGFWLSRRRKIRARGKALQDSLGKCIEWNVLAYLVEKLRQLSKR